MATAPLYSSPTVVEHAPTVPKTFQHETTERRHSLAGDFALEESSPVERHTAPANAPLHQVLFNGKPADSKHKVIHSTNDSITIVSVSSEFTRPSNDRAEDRVLQSFGFEPFELERMDAETARFCGNPHRRILKRRDHRPFTAESAVQALAAVGIILVQS